MRAVAMPMANTRFRPFGTTLRNVPSSGRASPAHLGTPNWPARSKATPAYRTRPLLITLNPDQVERRRCRMRGAASFDSSHDTKNMAPQASTRAALVQRKQRWCAGSEARASVLKMQTRAMALTNKGCSACAVRIHSVPSSSKARSTLRGRKETAPRRARRFGPGPARLLITNPPVHGWTRGLRRHRWRLAHRSQRPG